MPHARTEITEIVTGLATLGYDDAAAAIAARPGEVRNVDDGTWDRLERWYGDPAHAGDFSLAWGNGLAFLTANDGLRGRIPLSVEWKGPYRQPGYDLVPADLRVDHVYLISCKYLSRILFNASPSFLFDRLLVDRKGLASDWYLEVAPEEYGALYRAVRTGVGRTLPQRSADLDAAGRERLRRELQGGWPEEAAPAYRDLCAAVAGASAARWRARLDARGAHEETLWRLLRLSGAPYFVLGASPAGSLRLRIYTPWDWRQEFTLSSFEVRADPDAGQPVVRWRTVVARREHADEVAVDGHVEIRWGHGRFGGHPEAKVYLDTRHEHVPGYAPLVAGMSSTARQLGLAL